MERLTTIQKDRSYKINETDLELAVKRLACFENTVAYLEQTVVESTEKLERMKEKGEKTTSVRFRENMVSRMNANHFLNILKMHGIE